MPGIDSAVRTVIGAAQLTATNLAASATYTGPTVNGGADPETWPTRVRPLIRHLTSAKSAHAYLTLEESWDGTNWLETRRTPVPADGEAHTFDWPLHMQYHRLKVINGAQAQTGMRLATVTSRGEGGTMDEREVLDYFLSNTPVGAGATFYSPIFDLGPNASRNTFRAFARSDQAGSAAGFRIEWSLDGGVNFNGDITTAVTLAAGGQGAVIESKAIARHCRVAFGNGATAQTSFMLGAALVSI